MKKILFLLAAITLAASSYAQQCNEIYRKAINATCYLDSLICERIVSAHEMPTREECLQELSYLYSDAIAMVDIATEYCKAAQELCINSSEDIAVWIDRAIYSRQLLGRITGRIEKIETIIKVNEFNKAKWCKELRYRYEYIEKFSEEAKQSGLLKL